MSLATSLPFNIQYTQNIQIKKTKKGGHTMKIKNIAIDPGHGGRDPGVISRQYKEKDINLKLSAELFSQLLSNDYKPFLLREGDLTISLANRVQKAKDCKADLFISLHHNGHSNTEARGTETYFYPGSKIGQKTAKIMQQEIINLLSLPDRGIKSSKSFYVLRCTPMPAVLLEPLFLTNSIDRNTMLSENYPTKLAEVLVNSLNQLNK